MTANHVVENEDNYLVYGNHGEEVRVLPKALIETIEAAKAFEEDVADALWFHRTIKGSPEYKWVKISDLLNVNLSGWELHYAEAEGVSNPWVSIKLPVKVRQHENEHFESVDAFNQTETLYIDQDDMVLLVKLSNEDYATRIAKETEAFEEWRKRIAMLDSAMEARSEEEAKEESELDTWARELGIQAGL